MVTLTEVSPEVIGQAIHRYEFFKEDNVTPDHEKKSFCLLAWHMELETLRHFDVSFLEFAARHEDCDGQFVNCVQYDEEGFIIEKLLHVNDFVKEVFYPGSEPYFNETQRYNYRIEVENTLLNIIDGRA